MPTVKEKYGFLPTSVWNISSKSKSWTDRIRDTGDMEKTRRSTHSKYLPGLKYSEFHPDIAERIVSYWSKEEDLIIDSFGGRATRAIVASEMNRHYIGYEISPQTYQLTLDRIQFRDDNFPVDMFVDSRGDIDIVLGDGCIMQQTPDNSGDLVMTCPPYHDLEKYEDVPGQLSSIKDYQVFLDRIQECTNNIFRVLKPEKFCAWMCADWRRGNFFTFHIDSINCFKRSNMRLWDIIIIHNNSPFASTQISKCDKQKYTSKTHEYLLIFKKEIE